MAPLAEQPVFRLAALVEVGGPVVAILLAMGVVALAIILLKLWQFSWLRIGGRSFVEPALSAVRSGRGDEACALLEQQRNPMAQVLAGAIRGRAAGAPDSLVREEVQRLARRQLENLRSQLRGLEVIGTLSPLLGLLGTVLGMIEAFRQLQSAGSQVDPALLSGGIWEALLTTAVGLAVAIPAVAVLNYLERVIERFRHHMEDAVTQVFTHGVFTAQASRPLAAARRVADAT